MSFYNNLEKRFDDLTPDWIVSTGMILENFVNKEKVKWQLAVKFKNKIVRKASPIKGEDGNIFWNPIDAKIGIPDFVVMSSNQYNKYKSMLDRYFSGQKYIDPFRFLECKSGFYIEIFGERYHSGEFVRGLTKKEHENEVQMAYKSAGAELLILWEDDINKRWEEVCLPKIENFIETISKNINLPSWNQKKKKIKLLSDMAIQSLNNSEYWRNLRKENQSKVVDELIHCYSLIDYPIPDINIAMYDFKRFLSWAKKNSTKGTRFGKDCCSHFIKSIAYANVYKKKSKYDLWHDKDIMKSSILWQLSNEKGSHHANRFLNAMCYKSGFRSISNLSPSRAVQWCRTYGNVKNKGLFYDPCAGWGGRMLSAHAMGMEYIGIDANKELVEELNYMAKCLEINAKVYYGDSSDRDFVQEVMKERKADLIFTSPPYFNKEVYSEDPIQSTNQFPERNDWYSFFASKMTQNAINCLSDDGVGLINVSADFDVEKMIGSINNVSFDDFEVNIESTKGTIKERLIKFSKGIEKIKSDGVDYVVCKLCHKRFKRISRHLRSHHGISKEEYLDKFPGSSLICKKDSDRVAKENKKRRLGRKYKQRVVYRTPSGYIVKKKDAWRKAWGCDEPPQSSIIDASTVNLDPWKDKIESVDYVVCNICGFKGKNIIRHVKKEHNIDLYNGELKCQKSKENFSNASIKTWKTKKSS